MKHERHIECESLSVVSPDGESRIGLTAKDSGPSIHLKAESGTLDVWVLQNGPQIILSREGKHQLAISCTEWSNVVVIYDANGLPSARIEKRADSDHSEICRFENGQPVGNDDF